MKQVITTKKGTTFEREWDVKGYYKKLNIRIDDETFNKLKSIAIENQTKYSDIVRNLIKKYVEKGE